MKRILGLILRGLALLAGLAAVVAVLLVAWLYFHLRTSRPLLDGAAAVPGLAASVTIERDALGIPVIRGENRADLARALGYLHGQERFFQMDLMRRRSAGELSELIGEATVGLDRRTRLHRFRSRAREALALEAPGTRALVEAYAAGVNAGLGALGQKPFEYLVLRSRPERWQPEDCYLVGFAMALDLQESEGRYERGLGAVRDHYGPEVAAFFAPLFTPADAALDGSTAPLPPLPEPRHINLRRRAAPATNAALPAEPVPVGSNNFAVAGAHTADGGAWIGNDMHLELGVPNTWYRASLVWGGQRVTGLTLPGTPAVIVGSNGHVAWGFTNSYADTADVVAVETNSISRRLYRRGVDNLEFERWEETIAVRGGRPVTAELESTVWGPVIRDVSETLVHAYRWIMHEPGAINFNFMGMESARTVDEGIAVAHRAGIPAQNIVLADTAGDIAWTIAGALPKRFGHDGRFPVAWTYGDRGWTGRLPATEIPVIRRPATGRLWTANNRIVGGEALAALGDGGYYLPGRAAQIRDGLAALDAATPAELFGIQLDDRALFLTRWHALLQEVLTPEATAVSPARATLRAALDSWDGRATVDSASYRLVRAFRLHAANLALAPVFAPAQRREPQLNWRMFRYEEPLWQLVTTRPEHLLNPQFENWDALLLAAADAVTADLAREKLRPATATWGKRNTAAIRHPLGHFLPRWLTGWLDLPADPLPGDTYTPRAQSPRFGASNRLVVSPGREEQGLLHMPGGQSGHPLSPFYRAGHAAWVRGEPTPFLPGPAQHTLTLTPGQN